MADDARQSLPDLAKSTQPETEPLSEDFDFFELLRRLERRRGLFGYSGQADREPARLGQHIRLSFSAREVVKFQEADGKAPARITVASLGLLGPEGPMPGSTPGTWSQMHGSILPLPNQRSGIT